MARGRSIRGTRRYRFRHASAISTAKRPVLTSKAMPKLLDTSPARLPTSGTARSTPVTTIRATAASASCEKRRTADAR
jgi:hypothetical protein